MKRLPVFVNALQLLGWLTVLIGAVAFRYDCPINLLRFSALIQSLSVFDLWQHWRAGRRTALGPWVLQNGARLLFLALLGMAEQIAVRFVVAGVDMASCLLLVWSLAEMCRFSFYVFPGRLTRWLRYQVFLVAYPLGVIIELGWLYRIFEGTSFILGKVLLVLLVIAYLFGFPYLFLYLYRKRKK